MISYLFCLPYESSKLREVKSIGINKFLSGKINDASNSRIILEENESRSKYFSSYNKIDIALDPFPFTGGTVSIEGLWMGVPFVTLAGDNFVFRQGLSILKNIKLDNWIAYNKKDYINKVLILTSDFDKLACLRNNLRKKISLSPLFDAGIFAQNFEDMLLGMWRNWEKNNNNK